MRNMKVAHKLYAGFAVICLLLAVITGLAVLRLKQAQDNLQTLSSVGVASVDVAGRLVADFGVVRSDMSNIALAVDDTSTATALNAWQTDNAALDTEWAGYLKTSPASTTEQQSAYTAALADYRSAAQALMGPAQAADLTAFMQQRPQTTDPAAAKVIDILADIQKTEVQAAADLAVQGESAYDSALVVLLSCAALALLLAAAIAVVVARSITSPLAQVVQVMAAVATGRLDQRVGLHTRDELGQLAASTDASLEALASAMRDITGEATALATSSTSLSSVSAQMASGAEEAATQSQVVAAASEEVSVSISTVAAAGEEMTAAIAQIATATSDASAMASSAVAAARSAGDAIERLGVSSREIGDVVKLITSIAEQTNLLALNATIEAARAGEMGKGFAVVAGEVKELARQTAKATEEIVGKVSATQNDAAAAAAAVTQIGDVIARIDEVQATIAAAVEEQSATTSEMVRNVTEVSTGSAQISANISSIAAGTEQNRGSAAHTASTAGELNSAAARLAELTGRFTV